ncbi:hypothetical protein INR49_016613, partial [Caranx melampygus]
MLTNDDDQDSSHDLKSQGEGNERQDSDVFPLAHEDWHPSFCMETAIWQISRSCLEFKPPIPPPPGVQAFRPRPCVTLQDIPPSGFLAFMVQPSSPS